MATIIQEQVGELNIIPTYTELMKASTAEDSAYLRTKETITDFVVKSGSFTEREKAQIVSDTLSQVTIAITTHAMDVALKISTENRDAPYALTKLRVDTELADAQRRQMENQVDLTKAQISKMKADSAVSSISGWKLQADMYRTYGYDVSGMDTSTLVLPRQSVDKEIGKAWEENRMAQATVYDKWASAYRSNGVVSITQKTDGMLNDATGTSEGMALAQTRVAIRQERAFDDNMRQHVANSSATMLGTMLGSSVFDTEAAYGPYLTKWSTSIDYLNT